MHQQQAIGHRRPKPVDELQRRCTGATLTAIDHDKVRMLTRLQHRLDDAEPLPRVTDGQLEADRLAARQLTQPGDKRHQLQRRMRTPSGRRGRHHILPLRHAAGLGNLGGDLGPGQNAAMPGFGALGQLDFDHLDLR